MRLTIEDWVFETDITANMTLSAQEAAEHCTCGYCRNYYEAVPRMLPNLPAFLGQFGLCFDAPDELMPYEVGADIWYDGCFAVSGTILRKGQSAIEIDGIRIFPSAENLHNVNHCCHSPCFFLILEDISLPWILKEALNEVESPAGKRSIFDKFSDCSKLRS